MMTATDAVKWLTDTARGRAIVSEATRAEAETTRQTRAALLTEDASLLDREMALIRAHEPKRNAADAAVLRASEAARAAKADLARIEYAHRQALAPLSRRREHIASDLFHTRPREALNAFVAEMEAEIAQTYRSADVVKERHIDGVFRVTWSNQASIIRRAEAVTLAIRKARRLADVAVDEADFTERVAPPLRASLPALDERPAKYWGGNDAA